MAVKIRLKRMGKIRAPFYRVVVMDSRTKRDGRAIEEIGKYHPTEEPSLIQIDSDRVQYWLGNGAQPTEAAMALLKVTGDWQKFRGEPGAEGTLKVKEPKPAKKDLYEAAVAAAGKTGDDGSGATTPRKRAAKKTAPAAPARDEAQAENPEQVAAIEDAVEQDVIREEEAERSVTSEKGDGPAQAGS
jgi:small subunit ribosomal protein S16